ncbi:hypothetical protein B296_00031042 [Ensete ventricosum]|uniref:Uncharacterized protein n=1 Tax=Ensete ventricosum TaxID=4639 RepID=A0A426XSP0_ENSVE|nr:hypothetical protein B296_00031042 [Ensete ventricosum]
MLIAYCAGRGFLPRGPKLSPPWDGRSLDIGISGLTVRVWTVKPRGKGATVRGGRSPESFGSLVLLLVTVIPLAGGPPLEEKEIACSSEELSQMMPKAAEYAWLDEKEQPDGLTSKQDMEENRVEPQYGIMHFLKRVLLGLAIVGIN